MGKDNKIVTERWTGQGVAGDLTGRIAQLHAGEGGVNYHQVIIISKLIPFPTPDGILCIYCEQRFQLPMSI